MIFRLKKDVARFQCIIKNMHDFFSHQYHKMIYVDCIVLPIYPRVVG